MTTFVVAYVAQLLLTAAPVRPTPLEVYVAAVKANHKRSNGALLTIKAASEIDLENEVIDIDWEIDYTGPRQPFIVSKLTLTTPLGHQTKLAVYCKGRDNEVKQLYFSASMPELLSPSKYGYIVSENNKPVRDKIQLETKNLLAEVQKKRGGQLVARERLYFHLNFTPVYRGEAADPPLDAWTGNLWSQPIAVIVK